MAGKNETSSTNTEATWFVAAAVIGGALVGIWFLGRQYIVYAIFGLKWAQMKVYEMTVGLGSVGRDYLEYIEGVFRGEIDPSTIPWEHFSAVADRVGSVMKVGVSGLILALAVLVVFRMKGNGYSAQFTLGQLISFQARHWKTLATSAGFNPDKGSKNMMPAMRPVDWIHSLGHKVKMTKALTFEPEIRAAVEIGLKKQLGPSWKPVPKLPLHVRCLLAIFATHTTRKGSALDLRQQIAVIFATTTDKAKRDRQLEELIAPHLANEKIMKPLLEKAEKHAFVNTVMIRLLQHVRIEAGVLASADFLWVKDLDRSLWYALNDTGRHAYHIESAGIYSHFFHEMVARRAILEPKVDNAILGLEEYMDKQGIDESLVDD